MIDQQLEPMEALHPGLGPRRGNQLFVQTDLVREQPAQSFDQILPSVSRPPPVEAVIYHRSPEPGQPTPALPPSGLATSRRTSRLGLKGMFGGKSKGMKGERSEDLLDSAVVEEVDTALSEQRTEQDRAALDNVQEQQPKDRLNRVSKMKSTKKTPKLASGWEPPSLFQAYPLAVKEGHLGAPAMDVEAVLRLDKYRKLSDAQQDTSAFAAEAQDLGLEEEGSKDSKRSKKKRSSSLMRVDCVSKLYILTMDGYMLQYAAEGSHERPPERLMLLCKESAAFASDAIPGKHWVLQISQTSTDEGGVPDLRRPSMFPKFSFGSENKKEVSHFLLVMNSAEEMNSWLVTIRKEIQSLGGKAYRPDEKALKSPDEAAQRLRERPSRHILIEKDASDANGAVSNKNASLQSVLSPPNSGLPPLTLSKRPLMEKRRSSGNLVRASMAIFSPTSKYQVQPNLGLKMERASSSSPRAASFNLDKDLPERPVDDTQARIDALGIINAENLRLSHIAAANATIRDEGPLSPRSITASQRSPRFPLSAYNPEAAKYSMESSRPRADSTASRNGSLDKAVPPNFSTPSVSKRFSHARTNSASTRGTSRSGSGSAALGHTPDLTDGESMPQESVAGDVPIQPPSQLLIHTGPGEVAVAAPFSPGKPIKIDLRRLPSGDFVKTLETSSISARKSFEENMERRPAPEMSLPPSSARPRSRSRSTAPSPHPKRLSSLSYVSGTLPNSDQYLLPPPHPPPTTALPALPPGASPHIRPSSAQDNLSSRRSASPANPKPLRGLRRPASMQVTSPTSKGPAESASIADAMQPMLKLPVAPPLTIKERRRLSQRPMVPAGSPSAPSPHSPLPPPPGTAQAASVPGSAQLPTPPTSDTPPQQLHSQFNNQQLPDSPPRRSSDKVGPSNIAAITITKHADIEPAQDSPLQLSPTTETWGKYLDRIGAF